MRRLRHVHPARLLPPSVRAGVLGLGLGVLATGCATRPATRPGPVSAATSPSAPGAAPSKASAASTEAPDASGVWDWVFRSNTQQGDLRIEQEEWHLEQRGSVLGGYYTRQVVTLSTDRRPFQCNGQLGFVKTTRVRLVGEFKSNGAVVLREVGIDTERNPCDEAGRQLIGYIGQVSGDSLTLRISTGGEQRLVRRPEGSTMASLGSEPRAGGPSPPRPGPAGSQPESASDQRATQALLGAVALDGIWEWQFSAVDADGDLHVEREEWHLAEREAEIAGYYERTLERTRSSGVFSCNGTPQIRTTTRYTIKGQRFGDKLAITEVDYKLDPGPCENGMRRLDRYQGTVLPENQLLLTWGNGHQILKRRR